MLFALELERDRRHPELTDLVLLNPATGKSMTRPRLYERIQSMGRRAGVPTARPHRFRDTLAVDMLNRGANPYDVAKMLGDTIETVERYYMPFVKELCERVRNILETGVGLEELAQKTPEHLQITSKKPNQTDFPKERQILACAPSARDLNSRKSLKISERISAWTSHRRHNSDCPIHKLLSTKEKLADEPVSRILCAVSRSLTYVSGDWRS